MTRQNFTRWTCNVCRTENETPTDKQPKGWVGYGMTDPGVPAGEQVVLGHLCPDCALRVTESLAIKADARRIARGTS